jgi:hypothetical protein
VSECDDVISKIYMLVDKYHVPPSSVETEFFPYFLINSQRNCSATISMLLSREILMHTYPELIYF